MFVADCKPILRFDDPRGKICLTTAVMEAMQLHDTSPAPPKSEHLQTLTVSSKGQITISAAARRKLRLNRGTHLLEIVVGDSLMYVPEHVHLNQLFQSIQDSLRRNGVTAEDILADIEEHKEETFRDLYPKLADAQ
ncbi:MAG: AbrB/MazE/SpoVT family DNA-binding domain-containing protein [Chloroflexi bacterium]|nr:AbrB/MazE/SpoVT family DNA-binding domain-containing protein [Chloroflexota bacterium]